MTSNFDLTIMDILDYIFLTNQNEILINHGDSSCTRRVIGETPESIYTITMLLKKQQQKTEKITPVLPYTEAGVSTSQYNYNKRKPA